MPSELIERRLTAILAADVAVRHAHKQPPAPGQAGIFALGSNSVLEHLLGTSGLVDVRTVAVQAPLRLASASDALQMMQEAFGAYRAVVSDLSEAAKANAWAEVAHCLRQFETESGFATRVGVRTRTSSEAGLTEAWPRTAHSITSSARASSDGGTATSAFAVLRLTTSSNLFGPCTGRSAGFSPLRMRST